MAEKIRQADRVSYSFDMAVKNFGDGFSVHISYSTDVKAGETFDTAIKRASVKVDKAVLRKVRFYDRKRRV